MLWKTVLALMFGVGTAVAAGHLHEQGVGETLVCVAMFPQCVP